MQAIVKKPQQVDTMNLQVAHSRFLSSLKSYENRYKGQKSHGIVVKHQQEEQQWRESIDPDKLVLGKVIGSGAFGVVHKGSYHGQTVAVKVLDFGDTETTKDSMEIMQNCFKNEISLWHNLDHPNITKMIGATMSMKTNTRNKKKKHGTINKFCIVSEYLKGGSLHDYLKKNENKKLSLKTVIRFALDIAKGLRYLHSKKIIHFDVKPGNMLIDKNQTIKLADFGESVFEGELFVLSSKIGTPGYMAPEVFSKKAYGYKCDVFSFGICLWKIYCRDMTYTHNLANIPEDIYKDMRPSIPVNCPRSLARLMEKCWHAEWKKRPEMTSVVAELEEIAKSEGLQTMSEDKKRVVYCFGFFNHER